MYATIQLSYHLLILAKKKRIDKSDASVVCQKDLRRFWSDSEAAFLSTLRKFIKISEHV